MKNFSVVLLGSERVGKTSLISQMCYNTFSSTYQPTVEDIHELFIQLPDGGYRYIEILDTSGCYPFPAQEEVNIKKGQAFAIVYAIDNEESFRNAISQLDKIRDTKGVQDVPIVLVGNKQDLEGARVVSRSAGEQAAKDHQCIFMETSALQCLNVNDIFFNLVIQSWMAWLDKEDAKKKDCNKQRKPLSQSELYQLLLETRKYKNKESRCTIL